MLDAAYDLFQSKGYNGTGINDVAAQAGVTPGAMHHHFATKKQIGLTVIKERVATAVEEAWLDPIEQATDGVTGALGVFRGLARELDQQGSVRGCPVNNLALELSFADPDFREELRKLFEQWRETLAAKLRSEGDPSASVERSRSLATLLIAAYSGAMAMAKAEQCGAPLARCADELEHILR